MGDFAADPDKPQANTTTRIVGIGASAGGLAALELFLKRTPLDSGMAYVIVQHLDPTQKGMLPQLLQRATPIPVLQARQGMRIEPNHVYVIPPNTELSVTQGTLKLANPGVPRGQRLPINILFSSLASAQGERAIAVVLSGMGSDGTMGLQAIKAVGGLTLAQDPVTAQFDSMPKSAIAAGCADIVAPPDELPPRILSFVSKVPDPGHDAEVDVLPPPETVPLDDILRLLQKHTRHDFSLYKHSTLHRRIERRMNIHHIDTLKLYVQYLKRNSQEVDLLFKELLIGVTSFFRDAPVWEYLLDVALPDLLAAHPEDHHFRAWVIGCSTGEEAYSLAMVFSEAAQRMRNKRFTLNLQIFASDLSPDAIARARRGRYPLSIRENVSAARLERYFETHDSHYQIKKGIRDMVLFAQHDVVLDPPFTKLDMIACRNLLIYFDQTLQRRLIPLFHYSLNPKGLMMLGSAETAGRFSYLFTPIEQKLRLYARQEYVPIGGPDFKYKSFPPLSNLSKEESVAHPTDSGEPRDNLQAEADNLLLQVYAPAAVVVNSDGDIVYISGRTGKYLEPAAGKANWNFHAMVRNGLGPPLGNALKRAAEQSEPLQLHGLEVTTPAGVEHVDITVQALKNPPALRGMTMVIFRDVTATPTGSSGRNKVKGELETSHAAEIQKYRNEIDSLREEARATKEELQTTNEEFQSTNEELQSTNEELTTSKEEMQSMNEELQTINSELETKLDDLSLAQSDMQNVLNSFEIAILFLDGDLNVRRFTDRASKIFSLREGDVGRPLSDLTTSLQYPDLHGDAHETLRTLRPSDVQAQTDEGRWFSVRIMPYRRLDNVIDGVVITLLAITEMDPASPPPDPPTPDKQPKA